MIWRSEGVAQVLSTSDRHIDLCVTLKDEEPYRMTLFYGYADRCKRYLSWDLLRRLASQSSLPWVLLGDFNELLAVNEKWGRHGHPHSLIANFRSALDDCGLQDLGYSGHPFT